PPLPPARSLHDALPISTPHHSTALIGSNHQLEMRPESSSGSSTRSVTPLAMPRTVADSGWHVSPQSLDVPVNSAIWSGLLLCVRSEEHTSELQSRFDLV